MPRAPSSFSGRRRTIDVELVVHFQNAREGGIMHTSRRHMPYKEEVETRRIVEDLKELGIIVNGFYPSSYDFNWEEGTVTVVWRLVERSFEHLQLQYLVRAADEQREVLHERDIANIDWYESLKRIPIRSLPSEPPAKSESDTEYELEADCEDEGRKQDEFTEPIPCSPVTTLPPLAVDSSSETIQLVELPSPDLRVPSILPHSDHRPSNDDWPSRSSSASQVLMAVDLDYVEPNEGHDRPESALSYYEADGAEFHNHPGSPGSDTTHVDDTAPPPVEDFIDDAEYAALPSQLLRDLDEFARGVGLDEVDPLVVTKEWNIDEEFQDPIYDSPDKNAMKDMIEPDHAPPQTQEIFEEGASGSSAAYTKGDNVRDVANDDLMDYQHLQDLLVEEIHRRRHLEHLLEAEKRMTDDLIASHHRKVMSLERTLAKAERMQRRLEAQLTDAQSKWLQMDAVLEEYRADLVGVGNTLEVEREERRRTAELLHAVSKVQDGHSSVPALDGVFSMIDGLTSQAMEGVH